MTSRWVVAVLWLVLYGSFALLSPPLLDGADALHAEIAREMVVRGDPVTMYANGIRVLHDAPLLYWSMAGSMRVFGAGAPQARLPLAISVLLLALVVKAFARRAFQSDRAGLYAAVVLLLSPALFFSTRILLPGAISCLWLAAAVCCFWQTESAPPERTGEAPVLPCLGFAAACALNVLTIGPAGLLLPVGTTLLYLALTRGVEGALGRIGLLHPLLAACIFLAIAAPWHLLMADANPAGGHPAAMLRASLVLHSGAVPDRLSPWPLLAGLLPWCAFLPWAVRGLRLRTALHRSVTDAQRTSLLLAVAALLPVIFSVTTKRWTSALPSLPFLCMLTARWLDCEAQEAESVVVPSPLGRAGLRAAQGLLLAGVAAAATCAVWFLETQPPSPQADLAALLRYVPDGESYSLGLFLRAAMSGAIRGPVTIAGGAILAGALLSWQFRRSYRPHLGNIALAAATLVCLTEAHVALNTLAPVLSTQPLASAIAPVLRPGNRVVINGRYGEAATLGFYLQRDNLRLLQGSDEDPLPSGDAPTPFETAQSFRQQWTGPERIFLWTDPARLPALPTKAYIVAEGGGKQIVSNKAGPY